MLEYRIYRIQNRQAGLTIISVKKVTAKNLCNVKIKSGQL